MNAPPSDPTIVARAPVDATEQSVLLNIYSNDPVNTRVQQEPSLRQEHQNPVVFNLREPVPDVNAYSITSVGIPYSFVTLDEDIEYQIVFINNAAAPVVMDGTEIKPEYTLATGSAATDDPFRLSASYAGYSGLEPPVLVNYASSDDALKAFGHAYTGVWSNDGLNGSVLSTYGSATTMAPMGSMGDTATNPFVFSMPKGTYTTQSLIEQFGNQFASYRAGRAASAAVFGNAGGTRAQKGADLLRTWWTSATLNLVHLHDGRFALSTPVEQSSNYAQGTPITYDGQAVRALDSLSGETSMAMAFPVIVQTKGTHDVLGLGARGYDFENTTPTLTGTQLAGTVTPVTNPSDYSAYFHTGGSNGALETVLTSIDTTGRWARPSVVGGGVGQITGAYVWEFTNTTSLPELRRVLINSETLSPDVKLYQTNFLTTVDSIPISSDLAAFDLIRQENNATENVRTFLNPRHISEVDITLVGEFHETDSSGNITTEFRTLNMNHSPWWIEISLFKKSNKVYPWHLPPAIHSQGRPAMQFIKSLANGRGSIVPQSMEPQRVSTQFSSQAMFGENPYGWTT